VSKQQYPEPTVGALIFDPDGNIFLMRSHKWKDRYCIPGGHIEVGERIEDALKREVKEETGLDVFDLEFILFQEFVCGDSFWEKGRHYIFFDYACRTEGSDAAGRCVWVPVAEASDLDLERYTRNVIKEYLKRHPV